MSISRAITAAVIGGVAILIAIIASITVLGAKGTEIQPAIVALYTLIATGFVTALAGLLAHTLGFANGTVNGENAAQAQALRTVMHSEETPPAPPAGAPHV